MILVALALAMQPVPGGAPLDPEAMSHGFLSICAENLDDPDAMRAAVRRSPLGFARVGGLEQWEHYRAARAAVLILPGTGCAFEARLASRGEGLRVVAGAYRALGLDMPAGAVNRAGSGALYLQTDAGDAGRTGLTASLDWGRLGAPHDAPVTLSLWIFRRGEAE